MDNSTKKRPIFLCFIRKNRTKWQKWGQKSYPHLCRVIHNLHKKWRVIHIYARVIHNLSTIWQKLSTIHFSRNFFTEKKKERENTELALCGAGNIPAFAVRGIPRGIGGDGRIRLWLLYTIFCSVSIVFIVCEQKGFLCSERRSANCPRKLLRFWR